MSDPDADDEDRSDRFCFDPDDFTIEPPAEPDPEADARAEVANQLGLKSPDDLAEKDQ